MKISIKYFIATIVLLITVGSCTSDFEEMNTNPNKPTEVSPQYLLPTSIANVDR